MSNMQQVLDDSSVSKVVMARYYGVLMLSFYSHALFEVCTVHQSGMVDSSTNECGAPSFVLNISQALGNAECIVDVEEEDSQDFELDLWKEFVEEEMREYEKDVEKMPGLFLLDSDSNKENIPSAEQSDSSKKSVPFLDLDDDLVKEVNSGGKKMVKVEWARSRFDAWRVANHLPVDKKIEELDLREFARMLERFMLQLCKLNGKLYPPETLQDMFRKFGAMITRAQEVRIGITGIQEVPFDIRRSPIFANARKACVASMRRSRKEPGVCGKRKKVDEISYSTEVALLSDIDHSVFSPRGLQRRFMFYCVSRFAIRGREELFKLVVSDFQVLCVDSKECLEYNERTSKNYKVSMDRYQEEAFRLPLQCFEQDVVLTFNCLVRHLPICEGNDEGPRFCFMQCINSPKSHVWYNKKHRVSARVLGSWMKYMLVTIGVEGKFSGKSGRSSVVSRLARANVPIDVGMTVTGHRTSEAYKRYDKTRDLKSKAAMSIVGQPFNADGSRRMFDDVYNSELNAYDVMQNSGSVQIHSVQAPSNLSSPGAVVQSSEEAKVDCVVGNIVPAMPKDLVTEPASELDDPFFDTVSLEEIAGQNERLRKAFNLNLEFGSTRIAGGTFNNCIIVAGGSSLDVSEIVKKISGTGS